MRNCLIIILMLLTNNVICQSIDSVKIETKEYLYRFSINPVSGDSVVDYCDNLEETLLFTYSKSSNQFLTSSLKSLKYKLFEFTGGYNNKDSVNSEIRNDKYVYNDSIVKLLTLFNSDKNHTIDYDLKLEPHRRKTIKITFYSKKDTRTFSKMISSNGHSLWNSSDKLDYFFIKNNDIEKLIQNIVPSKFIQYKLD